MVKRGCSLEMRLVITLLTISALALSVRSETSPLTQQGEEVRLLQDRLALCLEEKRIYTETLVRANEQLKAELSKVKAELISEKTDRNVILKSLLIGKENERLFLLNQRDSSRTEAEQLTNTIYVFGAYLIGLSVIFVWKLNLNLL